MLTVAVKLNNDCRSKLHALAQLHSNMQSYFAQFRMLREKLIIRELEIKVGYLSCIEALGAMYISITCYGVISTLSFASYLS